MSVLKGVKILVVDDEPDLREIIASELEDMGAEVFRAGDGREGIEVYEREVPAIVLSDVRMPGTDGIQLLKHIRAIRSDGFFAFMTAFSDLTEAKAMEIGADAFFLKPFRLTSVFSFVERCAKNETGRPRRIYARVKCYLQVAARAAEPGSPHEILTHTLNLSEGGMFVQISGIPLPAIREEVQYKILKQEGLDREISGSGVCRWRRDEGSPECPRGFGMQFTELNDEDRELIRVFVEKVRTRSDSNARPHAS